MMLWRYSLPSLNPCSSLDDNLEQDVNVEATRFLEHFPKGEFSVPRWSSHCSFFSGVFSTGQILLILLWACNWGLFWGSAVISTLSLDSNYYCFNSFLSTIEDKNFFKKCHWFLMPCLWCSLTLVLLQCNIMQLPQSKFISLGSDWNNCA